MSFDDYWKQIADRNGWKEDTQLSVSAGGLRKLVAQAWFKGVESTKARDEFSEMFEKITGRRL